MAEAFAVLTGDTHRFGNRVTLSDGTRVDTTPPLVFFDSKEAADEAAHLIGLAHVEHGHPDDVDVLDDPDTGAAVVVQRPFNYVAPDGTTHVGRVGIPVGDHPLDYQLGEHDEKQAAAGAKAYRALKAKKG